MEWGFIGWKGGFYVSGEGKSEAGAKHLTRSMGFDTVGYRDSTGKVTITHTRGKHHWEKVKENA